MSVIIVVGLVFALGAVAVIAADQASWQEVDVDTQALVAQVRQGESPRFERVPWGYDPTSVDAVIAALTATGEHQSALNKHSAQNKDG